jgi:hypothetical protein
MPSPDRVFKFFEKGGGAFFSFYLFVGQQATCQEQCSKFPSLALLLYVLEKETIRLEAYLYTSICTEETAT